MMRTASYQLSFGLPMCAPPKPIARHHVAGTAQVFVLHKLRLPS